MIKNTLTCLQGALNYAILPLNYIQANPCIPVKIGKMPIDIDKKKSYRIYLFKKRV